MTTQKEFSGVYFGTSKKLLQVLDGLKVDKKIEDYAYIYHEAEEKEKKPHLHFWASPLVRLDVSELRKDLETEDGGCLPIRKSKFGDWLLYSLHDRNYLAFHGLVKSRFYEIFEVCSTFTVEQLEHLREQAYDEVFPRWNILDYVKSAAQNGVPWSEILTSGIIPPNQFTFYNEVYKTVLVETRKQQINQITKENQNNENSN